MTDRTPVEHLDPDQLSAFAEGALSAHERERTLTHLAVCAHCRQIVQFALPPFEPPAEPIREAAQIRRWFSGWRLAWIAGASFAALILFSLLVTRRAPAPLPAPVQIADVTPPQPLPVPSAPPRVAPAPAPPAKPRPASVPTTSTSPQPPSPRDQDRAQAKSAVAGGLPSGSAAASMARAAAAAPAVPPAAAYADAVQIAAAPIQVPNATLAERNAPEIPPARMVSTYSQGGQTLAIDAQGNLFRSIGAGHPYQPIKAVWPGRAVRIAAPASPASPPVDLARNQTATIADAAPRKRRTTPLFELTTDTGARWTSVDGKHWKPATK